MNRKLIITIAAVLITAMIPIFSWSLTMPEPFTKSALTYTVSVSKSGNGNLYWNYGKNMEFFLDGGWDSLNASCKVKNGENMKFSSIIQRGLIPRACSGWYFDGFYNSAGMQISSIQARPVDILRVTKNGQYYYDYFPSMTDSVYRNYTKTAYQAEVKSYLKAAYGTTRYKTLDYATLYTLPPKSMNVYAKFKEKAQRNYKTPQDYSLVYGDSDFFVWPGCPDKTGAVYRVSSAKLLTCNKASGFAQIKGEGVATVYVTFPETEKLHGETEKIKVRIHPPALSGISAKIVTVKNTKKVEVKWKNDDKSSGCEIQISDSKDFDRIVAKKTVGSGKTAVTTVSLTKKNCGSAKYVRIRPLKRSCGEKLYGPYTVKKI